MTARQVRDKLLAYGLATLLIGVMMSPVVSASPVQVEGMGPFADQHLNSHPDVSLSDSHMANQSDTTGHYVAQSAKNGSSARQKWNGLSPEQKRQYRQRLKRWKQLTPEQKAQIKARYERFKSLPPEKQNRIRNNWRRYQQLEPSQRQNVRQRYQRWK
ncbi:MAG: DUF3106 domain-containing protein, partial [Desulfobacterales bacterium]